MEQISAADVKEKSSNKSKRERYSAESDGGLKESDAASAWGSHEGVDWRKQGRVAGTWRVQLRLGTIESVMILSRNSKREGRSIQSLSSLDGYDRRIQAKNIADIG